MKKFLTIMLPILAILSTIFTFAVWPPYGANAQKNTPIDTLIAGPATAPMDTLGTSENIERFGKKVQLLKENNIRVSQGSQKTEQEVSKLEQVVKRIKRGVKDSDLANEDYDWSDSSDKYFTPLSTKGSKSPPHIIIQSKDCKDCYKDHKFWYRLRHLF